MEAYSTDTDTHYPSWEALVEAESNGYVAVVMLTRGKLQWPWVEGPYPDKADATRALNRMRAKWKREKNNPEHRNTTARFAVRPCWKPERG